MRFELTQLGVHSCLARIVWAIHLGLFCLGFRHRWCLVESLMRSDVVVLSELEIDHGLGLFGCNEPFGIEGFFAQRSVEAFVASILPR